MGTEATQPDIYVSGKVADSFNPLFDRKRTLPKKLPPHQDVFVVYIWVNNEDLKKTLSLVTVPITTQT